MNPTTIDEITGRLLSRRQILKSAGALGTAGLAALFPTATQADEEGKTGFQFLNISNGHGALSGKSIFITGVGKFGSGVSGGGQYAIVDFATSAVFDFGSWRAKKLVSFTNVGTAVAGSLGGTLTMDVSLRSSAGGNADATATVNCDGGVVSPDGGNGSGDVVTLVIKNGGFVGTFAGPSFTPPAPFNVTIFTRQSD
jgi:hypothetical protein